MASGMLRRRVFLHPEIIAASRNFVNVRLNIWQNETNYNRLHTLIGAQYSGIENRGNTAFAIFKPFAKGLAADSFPKEESIYYGSRVGRLYPICLTHLVPRKKRIAFIKQRRLEDLGETEVDPKLLKRIVWEHENGRDAPSVAKIMNELAARFPVLEGAAEASPTIPVMPNLIQAINFGAVDSRGVLALVEPSEGADSPMYGHVAKLLFEEGIAGRIHAVRVKQFEWIEAREKGLIEGGTIASGLAFLRPETFGRNAEVQNEIAATADEAAMRVMLTGALRQFRETWQKLDRKAHLREGIDKQMTWYEYDPVSGEIVDITSQDFRARNDKKRLKKALGG